MAISASEILPLGVSAGNIAVDKISVGNQVLWESVPPEPPNDQVPYTVPFFVVGGNPPPKPPELVLTSGTSDSLSVAATGTPVEVGFGAVSGFNFYLNGVKNNASLDTDGFYTYPDLDDETTYTLAFAFVNGAGTESARYTVTAATAPSRTEAPTEVRAGIDAIVASKIAPAKPKFNGAIVGVKTQDWEYSKAYGGDRTAGLALTTGFELRYGSITKLYTHMLVLMRVDAGLLSLNDTLEQFVSDIPNGPEVTIKDLIMMQSGIPDFLQWDPVIQQQYFLTPNTPLPDSTIMSHIRGYTPQFEPGKPPHGYSPTGNSTYSNSNTYLLGKILEALDLDSGTGRDIRTIMQEDLLEPLGLTETEWPTGVNLQAPRARAWSDNLALPTAKAQAAAAIASIPLLGILFPDPVTLLAYLQSSGLGASFGIPAGLKLTEEIEFTSVDPSYCGCAGILGGTISDLVKFGEALATRELLSPEIRELQDGIFVPYLDYTPVNDWDGPGHMMFGLGFIRWGDWILWIGNLAGYIATVFVNPYTGTVVAALQNHMQAETIDLTYQICYLLDPESTLNAPVQTISPQSIPAEGWINPAEGVYVAHDPGDEDGNPYVPLKVPFYV